MSDPQPVPGRKTPPRAEPLQPDAPGSGDRRESGSGGSDAADPAARSAEAERSTVERQKEQSDEALKNVREGYD